MYTGTNIPARKHAKLTSNSFIRIITNNLLNRLIAFIGLYMHCYVIVASVCVIGSVLCSCSWREESARRALVIWVLSFIGTNSGDLQDGITFGL